MVTNRARHEIIWIAPDMKSFGSRRKNSKSCSDDWHRWRFWSAFRHFGTHLAESFRMSTSSWMVTWDAQLLSSYKISSWIWSIISGVVTVLGRPGWGAIQVEKSPRLNWTIQFLTAAYGGACFPNVSVEWREFPSVPCLVGKKITWWQLSSRCGWNRARRLTCFLWASVARKDLQFDTWIDPSFQRHYRFRPTTSGSRSG